MVEPELVLVAFVVVLVDFVVELVQCQEDVVETMVLELVGADVVVHDELVVVEGGGLHLPSKAVPYPQ